MSRPPNEAIPSLLAALILGDLLKHMPRDKPTDGVTGAAACEQKEIVIRDAVEITPELCELVGIDGPVFDAETLEGHTRLLAAALIANVRKLGEVPTKSFHETGAKLSGMAYAEKSVLSALRTFTELAK